MSKITELLRKTEDYDKDERFMAISDLSAELQKDTKLDSALEKRICTAILDRLENDKSNDVQAVAVKCLSVLVVRASEITVGDVVDKLCTHLLTGNAELRDIYSIGLKTLIKDLPHLGTKTVAGTTMSLLSGIADSKFDIAVKEECLDIMGDLLKKFGVQMEGAHKQLLDAMLAQLADARPAVRKRATSCLGALSCVVSDHLLQSMVEHLLLAIKTPRAGQDRRTYIQNIGTVSRHAGFRLGRHLKDVVPILLNSMGAPDDEDMWNDASNELRENCLQAFESFVLRCPAEISEFLGPVRECVMAFMEFDPNYTYDSDEDEGGEYEMDEDEEDEYDEEYDDDDDTSWKVRRAGIKVLDAIVRTRPELLRSLYEEAAEPLVKRFREREESVKLDVLVTYTDLLSATLVQEGARPALGVGVDIDTGGLSSPPSPSRASGPSISAADAVRDMGEAFGAPPSLTRQRSSVDMLFDTLPSVVASAAKQLGPKNKQIKTKVAVWHMLRQLALVVADRMGEYLGVLLPLAASSLADRNATLRLEALLFLRMLLDTNRATAFHEHMDVIIPSVVECVSDEWYKIVAEAMRVVGRVAACLRPRDMSTGDFEDVPGFKPGVYVERLFNAVMPRLEAHDIDQEIKETAITSMGLILAHVGDMLSPKQIGSVMPLFLERLRNEITRMPALKALRFVAGSPLRLNLSDILGDTVLELGNFLRQQSRPLKQATLACLYALVCGYSEHISAPMLQPALREASRMINDADLQLAHQGLDLCVGVLNHCPHLASELGGDCLDAAVDIAGSPLLQGDALRSLLNYFRALSGGEGGASHLEAVGTTFEDLLGRLFARINAADVGGGAGAGAGAGSGSAGSLQKHAVGNIARCAAALAVNAPNDARAKVVRSLLADVSRGGDEAHSYLALLCVGEVGRRVDIPSFEDGVFKVLLDACASGGEDTKSAAAFALGGVCVGNMPAGLPVLQSKLEEGGSAYLLLSALREVLSHHGTMGASGTLDVTPYVGTVLPILEAHCADEDEGARNMTAECLGSIAVVKPNKIVPWLAEMAGGENKTNTRWTVITSVKYAVTSPKTASALGAEITKLMAGLKDEDLGVRRAALLSLNAVVHHRVALVRHLLIDTSSSEGKDGGDADMGGAGGSGSDDLERTGIFPLLYNEMRPKPELVREVDLGPFKHKMDDGLPLRKAAFACMDSILERARERVGGADFMPHVIEGLSDVDDVKMLCHQLVSKMCQWPVWQRHVTNHLDGIVSGLDEAFKKLDATGRGAVKAEASSDFIRSALRALDAISRVPDALSVRSFAALLERMEKRDETAVLLEAIRAERTGSSSHASAVPMGGAGGGAHDYK